RGARPGLVPRDEDGQAAPIPAASDPAAEASVAPARIVLPVLGDPAPGRAPTERGDVLASGPGARGGSDREPRADRPGLPPRALRRHAPTGDDLDGAVVRAGGAPRGRTHDRPRRHHP